MQRQAIKTKACRCRVNTQIGDHQYFRKRTVGGMFLRACVQPGTFIGTNSNRTLSIWAKSCGHGNMFPLPQLKVQSKYLAGQRDTTQLIVSAAADTSHAPAHARLTSKQTSAEDHSIFAPKTLW